MKHWRDKVIAHASGTDHNVIAYYSPSEYYLSNTGYPDSFKYQKQLIIEMHEYIEYLIELQTKGN